MIEMAAIRSLFARSISKSVPTRILHRNLLLNPERQNTHAFIDKAFIEVKGGRGGNGCVSFEVTSPGCKKPSGGSGGKGGNVYLLADPSINSLKMQVFHYAAGTGSHGGSAGLTGRGGRDVIVKVPIGTIVREKLPDGFYEAMEEEGYEAMDFPSIVMDKPRMMLLVAEGGKAGLGNSTVSKLRRKSTPATKMPGQPGETRQVLLELKIIADVGLVGYPNAGKSSLLRALSNATPKVASYPFTTLHPSIGVVNYSDSQCISIADIPGIIEGAHENRGLGHEFLKHIERTKILLYVLDMAGVDDRRPFNDLASLMNELEMYDAELMNKPSIIFANKYDLKVGKINERKVKQLAEKHNIQIITGSANEGEGLPLLAKELRLIVERIKTQQAEMANKISSSDNDSSESEHSEEISEEVPAVELSFEDEKKKAVKLKTRKPRTKKVDDIPSVLSNI